MAPPAVLELGTSSGFDLELMDRASRGHRALMAARDTFLAEAARKDSTTFAYFSGLEDSAQYRLVVHADRTGALGLDRADINAAIGASTGAGSTLTTSRTGGAPRRSSCRRIPPGGRRSKILRPTTSATNRATWSPLPAFSRWTARQDPQRSPATSVPSVKIQGEAAPGKSSEDAMRAMEEAARALPQGFDCAWTGLSFQEQLAGNQAPFLYARSTAGA